MIPVSSVKCPCSRSLQACKPPEDKKRSQENATKSFLKRHQTRRVPTTAQLSKKKSQILIITDPVGNRFEKLTEYRQSLAMWKFILGNSLSPSSSQFILRRAEQASRSIGGKTTRQSAHRSYIGLHAPSPARS